MVPFLFTWAIYDYLNHGIFNTPAFFLLGSQNLLYLVINDILKRNISKDEE